MPTDLTQFRGGDWLPAGRHVATVAEFRQFTANTGNDGVEIVFELNGAKSKGSWMLLPTAYWRLAKLCDACHVPEAQMAKFNERAPIAWLNRHVMGKHCGIIVTLQPGQDKYHEVSDVFDPSSCDQQAEPIDPSVDEPPPFEQPKPECEDDDIPF